MAYAAYLRIYQPVAAFHEPDRSRWAAYAASSARPRRHDSLAAEQAEALHRAIAAAEIAAAIDGVAKGERELALAMYQRAHSRWRGLAEYEMAN